MTSDQPKDEAAASQPDVVPVRTAMSSERSSSHPRDVVDLGESRQAALSDLATLSVRAAGAVGGYVLNSALAVTGGILGRFAASGPGRLTRRALSAAVGAADEDIADHPESSLTWAIHATEEQLTRVISVVVPVVVEAVDIAAVAGDLDINAILDEVDMNALLDRVDINALMSRVDLEPLMASVDVNALMERVDVNALMKRVDVNDVMKRVDVNDVIKRVDVNGVVERVDINAMLDRVDIKALLDRADIQGIIAESTGGVAGSALDVGRRQIVGLDFVMNRTVDRLLGRQPGEAPIGPPDLVDGEESEE